MGAVVVAVAVMMWMWSAGSLHFSGWLERNGNHPVRMAYLGVMVAVGAMAILVPLWAVLPDSPLSQGWTLRQLQGTQQVSVVVTVLLAVAGLWRAHMMWRPALGPKKTENATAKAAQKKRRP